MNRTTISFIFSTVIFTGITSLSFSTSIHAATDCGGRTCVHVLEARPYHVDSSCLSNAQFDRLESGFSNRLGSVAFLSEEISSSCIVDRNGAPRGAGVSPFKPCGFGPSPFLNRNQECVFAALISKGPLGVNQITIINPDSMHPGCLISANPTPHP